jgi:hypothetical protein
MEACDLLAVIQILITNCVIISIAALFDNTYQKWELFLLKLFRQQKRAMSKNKLNSVAFNPQANYTDRATAACRRS